MDLNEIKQAAYAAAKELLAMERPGFAKPKLLVVGCSSSEIAGGEIGHMSSPEIGKAVVAGVLIACVCIFFIPPIGEIANSAISIVSEFLVLCGALLGIKTSFDIKLKRFQNELDDIKRSEK